MFLARGFKNKTIKVDKQDSWYKQESEMWYKKAAQQGNFEAMYEIASIYRYKKCYKRDRNYCKNYNKEKAINFYLTSAKGGYYKSYSPLAQMLYHKSTSNNITDEDKKYYAEKSNYWYKKSYEYYLIDSKKNSESEYEVAIMTYNGIGTDRNIKKGIRLLKKVANKGNKSAINKLLQLYSNGDWNGDIKYTSNGHKAYYIVKPNKLEALKWCFKAYDIKNLSNIPWNVKNTCFSIVFKDLLTERDMNKYYMKYLISIKK